MPSKRSVSKPSAAAPRAAKPLAPAAKQHKERSSSTVKQINGQTPGPAVYSPHFKASSAGSLYYPEAKTGTACNVLLEGASSMTQAELDIEGRLLSVSRAAFDRAGRALGIDATELAEGLDIATALTLLNEASVLMPLDGTAKRARYVERLAGFLASLPPSQAQQAPAPAPSAPTSTAAQDAAVALAYADGSHPFTHAEVYDADMEKAATDWIVKGETVGLVDESQGGIVGYVHRDHIDRIVGLLNVATLRA